MLHESKEDGINRVYTKLLPLKYHNNDATGYYVDGIRVVDQKGFKARYIKPKSEPKDIEAEVLPSGDKIGALLSTSLTADGADYVREAVAEGGEVAEFWRDAFDWIDFD